MNTQYAAKTDPGRRRTQNEDCFLAAPEQNLFLIADGMGGHAAGEIAAKMASESISGFYEHTKNREATWPYKLDQSLSYVENRLVCGIRLANRRIFEAAVANERQRGMGTTLVATALTNKKIYIGHVGDSRAYAINTEGKITQLTRDHSLLEDYREAHPTLTEEEERNFPHKNIITRALGMRETVQVDISQHTINKNNTYLICSDGLSSMIPDEKNCRNHLPANRPGKSC